MKLNLKNVEQYLTDHITNKMCPQCVKELPQKLIEKGEIFCSGPHKRIFKKLHGSIPVLKGKQTSLFADNNYLLGYSDRLKRKDAKQKEAESLKEFYRKRTYAEKRAIVRYRQTLKNGTPQSKRGLLA